MSIGAFTHSIEDQFSAMYKGKGKGKVRDEFLDYCVSRVDPEDRGPAFHLDECLHGRNGMN